MVKKIIVTKIVWKMTAGSMKMSIMWRFMKRILMLVRVIDPEGDIIKKEFSKENSDAKTLYICPDWAKA